MPAAAALPPPVAKARQRVSAPVLLLSGARIFTLKVPSGLWVSNQWARSGSSWALRLLKTPDTLRAQVSGGSSKILPVSVSLTGL